MHVSFARDRQFRQPGLPGRLVGKLLGTLAQLLDQGRGKLLPFPVSQGRFIDRVPTLAAVQDLQKVQPALAVGALETGEQIVADHRAIAIAPLVSGSGIIRADVHCRLQPRCPHFVFLLMEKVLVLRQQAIEFAFGNIHTVIVQTL